MKKIIFTLLAVCAFSFSYSQEIKTNAGTFTKPATGETAFEIQFMPNLDGSAMFADRATVMMRRFKSETKAIRWTAILNVTDQEDSDVAFDVSLGYGVENHFSGAERLSTFWGYGANVGYNNTSESLDVGGGVFLGTDYYLIPKVYVGLEIGYRLNIEAGDSTSWGLNGGVNGMMRLGFRL